MAKTTKTTQTVKTPPTPCVILSMGFEFATMVPGLPTMVEKLKPSKSGTSNVSDALNADTEFLQEIANAVRPILAKRNWALTQHNGTGVYANTFDCRIGDPITGSPMSPQTHVDSVESVLAEPEPTETVETVTVETVEAEPIEPTETESIDFGFESMKRPQLIEECGKRGLKKTGKMSILVDRLNEYETAQQTA